MEASDLDRRFVHHPPKDGTVALAHSEIRDSCRRLADHIDSWTPDSREKSTAIAKVEEAMMWANAAIARNGTYPKEP